MMTCNHGWRVLACACAGLLLPGGALRGQSPARLHVLAAGGVAVPGWSNPDELRTGYHLQLALEGSRARSPVAFRLEGMFDRFGLPPVIVLPPSTVLPCPYPGCDFGASAETSHEQVIAGTVDVLVGATGTGFAPRPYAIAGAGVYGRRLREDSGPVLESRTDVGVNAGAGIRLPRLHAFLEVRAHLVNHATAFVPIMVGVRF